MTATAAGVADLALALIAAVVLLSMVLGAVDVIRQPGWAWRAAGEPKLLCLALVLLLPGVGLAIYVLGARPKVVAVASAGRAANLPFERFGDREELATESVRSIQALTLPTTLGSFGERRPARMKVSGPDGGPPDAGGFFDDPDLVTVGGPAGAADPVTPAAATATEEPTIHIPGSAGRPYRPKQRTSLQDGQSLAAVAAQVLGATEGTVVRPTAPTPMPLAPAASPAPFPPATGPAGAVAPRPATRVTTDRATAIQLAAAPVATARTPEIFRPRPVVVAPLPAAEVTSTATMAARWLPDPTGRHQYRYWDGGCWTENVCDAGVESQDPVIG